MANHRISELTLATDLQDTDVFPIVRGANNLKVAESTIRTYVSSVVGENKDVVAFEAGQAVARHPSGSGFLLARADLPARGVIGLAPAIINPTFSGIVQTGGILALIDWSGITGAVDLQALVTYFLSDVPGKLSSNPPTTLGFYAQPVGYAIDARSMFIQWEPGIRL